jgi:predicted Zn-dependent protease
MINWRASAGWYGKVVCLCLMVIFFAAANAHAVPLIRDAETEHTLRLFADPVFKVAGLQPRAVNIFIVNDGSINAFVAGGANMFLVTGLILASETPDMLIGVIAHETGHIAGGHLARGGEKLKDAQLGTIMSVVLGAAAAAATGKPEAAAAIISGGQNTLVRNFLAYTRTHEEAADQAALRYLDKLGISAQGMLKTFQLLQRNERMRGGRPDPYMMSHPLNAERVEHVRNHIANSKIEEGTYPKSFIEPHQRMTAKLFAFLHSPERTLQKYPASNTSLAARMARSIAYYKMPDINRALSELESLIAENKNDAFLYDLKGQMLFENNRPEESLVAYQQANRLMPNNALILTDLGKVELAQKNADIAQAIRHLEKASNLERSNSQTWRFLATAYGKQNNLGLSNLALAEEALLQNEPDDAMARIEQALLMLKEESPSRQRALDLKEQATKLKKDKEENSASLKN